MIRKTLGWALVSLTGLGLYMSWGNLYDLALACGMPPERAVVFPIVIDVVTVVAMLLALRGGDQSRTDRLYPWIALGLFGAATIGGNALHVLTATPGAIVVNEWIAVVANSLPAVAMLLTTHMAAVTVYAPQKAEELAEELTHEERVDKVAEVLSERDAAVAKLFWEGESDRSIVEKLQGQFVLSRSTVARIRKRLLTPTTEAVPA
jgi:hypothetical protein